MVHLIVLTGDQDNSKVRSYPLLNLVYCDHYPESFGVTPSTVVRLKDYFLLLISIRTSCVKYRTGSWGSIFRGIFNFFVHHIEGIYIVSLFDRAKVITFSDKLRYAGLRSRI